MVVVVLVLVLLFLVLELVLLLLFLFSLEIASNKLLNKFNNPFLPEIRCLFIISHFFISFNAFVSLTVFLLILSSKFLISLYLNLPILFL